MLISAVIPTRGDVPLGDIISNLLDQPEIAEIIIQVGNSPFGRYLGSERAQHPVIFTQDDDTLPDLAPIITSYKPGIIVNVMTEKGARNYDGAETLVGYGAIFDRDLVKVLDGWERDDLFLRECDRVFTSLNRHETTVTDVKNLPVARSGDRLYKQPEHREKVRLIRERIAKWKSRNKQLRT